MTTWVVRAGSSGEDEDWNLTSGRAGVGWPEIGDMSACHSREDVRALVDAAFPTDSVMRRANYTGQLWALRGVIRPGDLIIMPLKRSGELAFGTCRGGYSYDASATDRRRRHHINVDWHSDHFSRSVLKDDLLNMINGAMTVFSPSRHSANDRLHAVLRNGVDPGFFGSVPSLSQPTGAPAADIEAAGVLDPETVPTMDAIRDRIRTHIVENFSGHKLTYLVADILTVLGYVCNVSPEGPDGGVDILAGRGPLGLDSPTLVVEVKSESTQIGAPVVRGLQGAVTSNQADQGLLVAWGGINTNAKREFSHQRTRMRFWDSEDLMEQLFKVYAELPQETRNKLPLKLAWVLDEEPGA